MHGSTHAQNFDACRATNRVTDSQGATTPLRYMLNVTAAPGPSFASWGGGVAATSDQDGNGYTALAEYALGAPSPGAPFAKPVHGLTLVSGIPHLTLTAILRVDDPAMTVRGESSVDFSTPSTPWRSDDVGSLPSADQTGVPNGCERRIYHTPTGNDVRKFLRLIFQIE
jgi:hypothetical protein